MIETEKVSYDIEAPESGVLKAVLCEPDDLVPVGTTVGIIADADEQIDVSLYKKLEPVPSEQPESAGLAVAELASPQSEPSRVSASPAARKLARKAGVELGLVKGSGQSGRIGIDDVQKFLEASGPALSEEASPVNGRFFIWSGPGITHDKHAPGNFPKAQ